MAACSSVVANGQRFIEEAPVTFIYCADLEAYSAQARQRCIQEYIESGLFAEWGLTFRRIYSTLTTHSVTSPVLQSPPNPQADE